MNNKDWWLEEVKGISLIRFRHFEKQSGLKYFISTRHSGYSKGTSSSFNLGFQEHDTKDNVIGNRKLLADALKIPLETFVFANQTHNDNIKTVEKEDCGKGLFSKENAISDTDGFIVSIQDLCAVIMVADCVPVIIYPDF